MSKLGRELDAWPCDPLHGSRPRLGVQRVGSVVILNPEAASLPAPAWDDDAVVSSLAVLIHMHLDLNIALKRK